MIREMQPGVREAIDSQVRSGRTLFGHPIGLSVLFFTQMWEQVSWYGMRSLLVYYLTKGLHWDQPRASLLYGTYAAAVNLTPFFGGLACDRLLGHRRSVILGGLIMAAGHVLLTFDSFLLPALGLVAIGTGLFVPSLPSQVSALYGRGDPRQASAYSVYYVGVNLGAFLAPFVCGTLGETYGWHWGFGAAALGMSLSLFIYVAGSRYLPADSGPLLPSSGRLSLLQVARENAGTLVRVAMAVALFRTAYEQVGNTVALWADVGIDRHIGADFEIPRTWFQSLNPLVVFLAGPLLAVVWMRRASHRSITSSARRMAFGALLVSCAYALLYFVALNAEAGSRQTSWIWLVAFFAIFTIGELFILPIGLSLFARLAPPELAATTIACWFLAAFAGNLLAGAVGTLWSVLAHSTFFLSVAILALLAFTFLLSLDTRVRASEAAQINPTAQVG